MTKLQQARAAVFTYFLLCGSAVTVWATHIPVIEKNLSLSTAQIGIIVLILGGGALASMQLLGGLIDKHGSAKVLVGISIALGLSLMLPGFANTFFLLAVSIFILGACIGGTDIAMNAHALEVERAYKRHIFSAFHAMWSIGGVIGSVIVSAALAVNSPMWLTMSAWGFLTIGTAVFLSNWLLKSELLQGSEESKKSKTVGKEFRFVIFVGLVSAAGAIVEGVGIDWSALYSVTKFNVSTATAALSVTFFAATMAAVRFFADKVVAKFSRIFVIRLGAAISAVGIAFAMAAPTIELSWLGWAITGIGISAVVPQCMAYGSEIGTPENQGRNLAKVVGLTYAGVLGGPAIIGFVGQVVGLQMALSLGIGLSLFVALGTIVMKRRAKDHGQII